MWLTVHTIFDYKYISAGVRQKEGESRLALVERNVDVLKSILLLLVYLITD